MANLQYIIPECYADTNLISTIVQANVNYQKGCNQVAGTMQKKFVNRFAVGIIDYDKRTSGYLDQMNILSQSEHLQLYKHPNRPHYIITIKPAIEIFILSCATELHLNLCDFDIASSLEGLKKQTKRVDSNADPKLTALFRTLRQSTEMMLLLKVLQYLNEKQYCAEEDVLKSIFFGNFC